MSEKTLVLMILKHLQALVDRLPKVKVGAPFLQTVSEQTEKL